ncbi:MAG: hypothetical protein IMZ53_06540 [Thermoplasmata archaeon]|nr:hypothetical protein [Thermoplasmata archaeon]
MNIAIFCPIGPLDRYGYQYNFKTAINSFCGLADRIYLVSTTRNRSHVDEVVALSEKITVISDTRTWFQINKNGDEFFEVDKPVKQNAHWAMLQAKSDGMDCIIELHINQYIPNNAVNEIRNDCRNMIIERSHYSWLYRRYQLADRLFNPDVRFPWILNLQVEHPYVYSIDSICNTETEENITMETGDFREKIKSAIVDAGMELKIKDLTEARKYTRNYIDLNPAAPKTYEWDQYLKYYRGKYNAKILSNDHLDEIGQAILNNAQKDFVSRILLREYHRSSRSKDLLIARIKRALSMIRNSKFF